MIVPATRHIGLIAGGGHLPVHVAQAVRETDDKLTVIEIDPDARAGQFPIAERLPLSSFGKMLKRLKKAGVTHVCLAGTVSRPDFGSFKPDLAAMRYLPGTVKAARQGDDSLLRHVMGIFEQKGFSIIAPQALCERLLLTDGSQGQIDMSESHRHDAQRAMEVAELIGSSDIGQGAIVAAGVVLAVEAQEGTDAMLERVAALPASLRGTLDARQGVLAKRLKPGQDDRVDLPTIGPRTVELASQAGLAGIIADAGKAFIIDRDRTVDLANKAGLFIIGLPKRTPRDD